MKTILALLTFVLSLSLVTPPTVREGVDLPEPVSELETIKPIKTTPKVKKPVETVKLKPQVQVQTGCETFRTVTAKYFPASQVDNALLVFSMESGCKHPTAINATGDSGLCQLNNEHIVDLDAHVKRCSEKYYNARIGINNWSAWYATCSVTVPGSSLWNPVSLHGLSCG